MTNQTAGSPSATEMPSPLVLLALTLAGLYCAKLWRDDLRAAQAGRTVRGGFPGAVPAPPRAVGLAIAGALVLLALETVGELTLGIAAEQTRMNLAFAAYSVLAAPIIEEVIFRGWLVLDRHGPAVRWAGIVAASVLFALLHPFLWAWDDAGFRLTLTLKGWFSTTVLFLSSLWF
ncbi:MAG: CPBP family intramembrane metalloprotease [Verrucomicrobia bacterium]|nr:CPBP family intramembrane metalloprotease [Verrucomicrobiota bacterium]